MKRIYILLALVMSATMMVKAGITTYTFTNEKWASKQGSTVMDGKTDGWVCDVAGVQYDKPTYQTGVKVTKKGSGAGATSVKSFSKVRRITLNYATTTSGKGSFRIQVGENTPIDTAVSINTTNTDMVINLPSEQTGKIKFSINCSNNSIWLASVAIRSQDGTSPVFTEDSYQLVTDVHQLRDSDQVIFGVADGTTKMIMGYFDENISQNNIHAIKGVYNTARTQVDANDDAIYTLWKETGETDEDTVYIFQDELRYEEDYLVASGGKSNNYLTVWNNVVSPAYGNYGFWRITIAGDGVAVIENAGISACKYIQYNLGHNLFGCYADPNSQTKVCLFHLVKAIGKDDPAIVANMVNFGNVRMTGDTIRGERTIEVNANKLTEDITCTLRQGKVFSIGSTKLDRDGDNLMVRYTATEAGMYVDTLVLTSTGVTREVSLMVNVIAEKTIAEAVKSADFEMVYLNPVVVTKKNNQNVFIRDSTGSMLIWDLEGQRYAKGLEQGHVLSNVQGRFKNYFGVPELSPTTAWSVAAKKVDVQPDVMTEVDSADVCRYVRIENAVVDENSFWQDIYVTGDPFQTSVIMNQSTTLDAIVYIDHDALQLWMVKQEKTHTSIEEVLNTECSMQNAKFIRNGQLYIRNNGRDYNANGQTIK